MKPSRRGRLRGQVAYRVLLTLHFGDAPDEQFQGKGRQAMPRPKDTLMLEAKASCSPEKQSQCTRALSRRFKSATFGPPSPSARPYFPTRAYLPRHNPTFYPSKTHDTEGATPHRQNTSNLTAHHNA